MNRTKGYNDPTLPIDKKVAIVGIGCRYPNDIKNARDFWKVVSTGQDCMKEHPKERLDPSYIYPHTKLPGKIYSRAAGYLSQDVNGFDRLFFQISPEEANHMDPQLRLLLEVVWESLADYGVSVSDLRQSDTGVYIGVMAKEYTFLLSIPEDNINQYTASGNNSNMMSNRISYQFDFQGPSITYDTACSSSLYAIHHACEAIRNGDCNLALAGGVNLLLLPATSITLCQAGMLSHDGRCKSFDKSADGYARADGAGILVLKSLKQAMKDEDRIYAVIRGGALNNDGKTSGITTPSAQSQMSLLRRAYEITKVSPQEVPYVEAHGTGTQAGDTAEATALGTILGSDRGDKYPPLIVGSVKSNFGHTEGAAGVAGVIKTSLVLQKKQIPNLVNFQSKNKNIDWDKFQIIFPKKLWDWPKGSKHLAGCSSFGFGGANAHLVLEAAPDVHNFSTSSNISLPTLLLLSASSNEALNQLVKNWISFLGNAPNEGLEFSDIVRTAATRSTHHPYRLAICCESMKHSIKVLRERQTSPSEIKRVSAGGRIKSMPDGEKQKLVFVFSGMGTQWWGMGRQLMKKDIVFRRTITEADDLLKEFGASWSLKDMLTKETNKELMNKTEIAQPAICALQIALAEVYRQMGISPHAVIGHSVGEVAAAFVAGYLTFRDAMKLIYLRGKTLELTTGKGTMAAILQQADYVREKLLETEFRGKVDIACVNSPTQTVVSGNADAVTTLVNHFKDQGVRCVNLKVKNAFHSFQQEEVKTSFLNSTGTKFLQPPTHYGNRKYSPRQVPMISTVTGEYLTAKDLNDNQYWWKNIRQTVEFEKSLTKLLENGYNILLEIGPHPSLASAIKGTMAALPSSFETSFHDDYAVLESLRRPVDLSQGAQEKNDILLSIAKLYVQGYPLNLDMLFPNEPFNVVSLPTYPWQRQKCIGIKETAKKLFITPRSIHPLLGEPLVVFPESVRLGKRAWKNDYDRLSLPWLPHHKIENVIVLPGAAYIEMMLNVAKEVHKTSTTITLEEVHFSKFHYSPECKGTLNTSALISSESNQWQVAVKTYSETNQKWTQNATCDVSTNNESVFPDNSVLELNDIHRRCTLQMDSNKFYKKLAERGVEIGDLFGCVSRAFYNGGSLEGLVYANLPETIKNELNKFIVHPGILDAAFQLFAGFSFGTDSNFHKNVEVPKFVGKVTLRSQAPSNVAIHGKLVVEDEQEAVHLIMANAENGKIFCTLEDIKFAHLGSKKDCVHIWTQEWIPISRSIDATSDRANGRPGVTSVNGNEENFLLISDRAGIAKTFLDSLRQANVSMDRIQITDMSEYTNRAFKNQEGHQNIVVLSFMNESNSGSLDQISKEQFDQSQIHDPVSLIKKIIHLTSENVHESLSVWIITKGGAMVCNSDLSVNPLMCNGHSLAMTFMNEYPELFVASLDLPQNQNMTESIRWMSKFFLKPERSENCLALRARNEHSENGSEFQIYTLRINIQSTSDLYIDQVSENWMIDLDEVGHDGQIKFNKSITSYPMQKVETSTTTPRVDVHINAFAVQYRKGISNPTERLVGYLFGGSVLETEVTGASLKNCQNVIGYSECSIVTPVVKTNVAEMIPISKNVRISHALFVVQSYFPMYLALQISLNGSEKVIMITSNNVNIHQAFKRHVEVSKGVKVIIYAKASIMLPTLSSNDENVAFATSETIHTVVENGSVDVLLLNSEVKLGNTEIQTLFEKMRFGGTVAALGGETVEGDMIRARQIGVRVIEPEYLFAPEQFHLRKQLIHSLLKMFFTDDDPFASVNHLVKAIQVNEVKHHHEFHNKILLTNTAENVSFGFNDTEQLFTADPESSYLVVGGTKGLGFEIVRWLLNHGAKCIFIAGRNKPAKSILEELHKIKLHSINVEFIQCDVSDERQVKEMLLEIKNQHQYPLSGIFHSAAVFNDQRLENVAEEGWARVVLPKAYGFLLLHQLTVKFEMPIKIFVAISSVVQFIGNDGQGSYCGANNFLALLCQERRRQGLPATVIAPGAISEVGFASRQRFDRIWEARGIKSLSPSQVTSALSWSLVTESPIFGLTDDLNLENFFKGKIDLFKNQEKRNHFSVFKKEFPVERGSSVLTNESQSTLASLDRSEVKDVTEKFLVGFLQQRLGISEDISTELPLSSLGFDSAMSWELSSLIKSKFNVVVSSVELLNDSANISLIGYLISSRVGNPNSTTNASTHQNIVPAVTLWLTEPCQVRVPRADLFCFPPTGKGSTLFAEWGDIFSRQGIRVVVSQIPGWEGRENEPASHNLMYLVKALSNAIISRPAASRVGFFGCGIGSLLALEIARYLQGEHNVIINHIYVCGWHPPSTPYPCPKELDDSDKERVKTHPKDKTADRFLDNRDIRQSHVARSTFRNIKASKAICKKYKYVMSKPLECNMTLFSGVSDPILTQKVLGKWRNEIHPDKEFHNVAMFTNHKLLRNEKCNRQIVSHISRSLLIETATGPLNRHGNTADS